MPRRVLWLYRIPTILRSAQLKVYRGAHRSVVQRRAHTVVTETTEFSASKVLIIRGVGPNAITVAVVTSLKQAMSVLSPAVVWIGTVWGSKPGMLKA